MGICEQIRVFAPSLLQWGRLRKRSEIQSSIHDLGWPQKLSWRLVRDSFSSAQFIQGFFVGGLERKKKVKTQYSAI